MKFYALHKLTLKTGNAGIIKVYVEPVYEDEIPRPEIQGFEWEEKRTQVYTNYYSTLDEVESAIVGIYAHQSELDATKDRRGNKATAYPDVIYIEEIIAEGLEKLMISKDMIRAIMHLYHCSYSIAMLRLLCARRPSLPIQYYGDIDNEKYKRFCFLNANRKFSYFGIKNQTNSLLKYVAEAYDVPVEVFLEYDLDYYFSKPSLEELVAAYKFINNDIVNNKLLNLKEEKQNEYTKRYIAITCIMMENELSQLSLAKLCNVSSQTISNYLFEKGLLSKEITYRINEVLININSEIKKYL